MCIRDRLTVRNMHARLDPVPSGLTDRIKFELTLAALHAEIAELQRVSLAGVRADDTAYAPTQSVTFTSSRLSLMVTLTAPTDDPDQAREGTITVDGWVTVGGTVVELRVGNLSPVSYTHLRAHETVLELVCRLLLDKKNKRHWSTILAS